MKTILLLSPPLYFSKGIPHSLDSSVPALGLLYLASYINRYSKNIKANIVDIAAEKLSLDQVVDIVKKEKPFIVGISSMTPQLQGAVELAHCLKSNFKNLKIVLGGPHISADPDFLKRHTNLFDYGITGEAEITLLETLNKLITGKKIPRLQNGEIIKDLDIIPIPDKKLVNREKYIGYESMMFSRGCPYHCYYCSRPSISRMIRYRSAENVIQEIKYVYKYCHGKIDFQDDTFTLNKEKVVDFCRQAEKTGLKLDWRCNTRIDLVDEELLKAMKQAGCSLIHFGIEAGNEKIRREIVNKGQFTNKQIYNIVKLCHKYGIKFAGYFMIGHPGETKKNMEETKKMILGCGADLVGLSIPLPFPGSTLYGIAYKQGIINENIIDDFADKKLGEGYSGNYPVFTSEKVSPEYVFSLMKEINRKFYITPKMFWRRFKEDAGSISRLKKDFFDLISLISKGMSSRKPYFIK